MTWTRLTPEMLRGEGLGPYPAAAIGNLFDWSENPGAGSSHLMPHAGDFLVDIVRIEANAVHQPGKPDDEIVAVLAGVLELTDDGTGRVQSFAEGEVVLIPRGWAGLYRCIPAGGRDFLEIAIVPHDYFDPRAPDPTGASPRRVELPASGPETFLDRRYVVEAQGDGAWEGAFARATDEIVFIRAGRFTLSADGATEHFGPGDIVILPRGLTGEGTCSADFRALGLRWLE